MLTNELRRTQGVCPGPAQDRQLVALCLARSSGTPRARDVAEHGPVLCQVLTFPLLLDKEKEFIALRCTRGCGSSTDVTSFTVTVCFVQESLSRPHRFCWGPA